ncbi:thiamine-binding protein [Longirhabdus pacifica]|uniref:thiamine-binding protein n=1 Tax=Longirhabdus pacifica TaxID=2305227 RepID=UPI0010092C64|nr:MTH1187 family thiamine-binding protein [Longirhabdus pacifica]
MSNTLLSVQIIPKSQDGKDVYELVDRAIKVIDDSNVKYEVHPLETTMEGDLTQLLLIVQEMNHIMIQEGCSSVISQIKILHQPSGITMDTLTEKYREQ